MIATALADGIRELGISALNWSGAAQRLRRRIAWANETAGETVFPDMSDTALLARLDAWLTPHLSGLRTLEAASKLDLLNILKAQLSWDKLQELERIAPETYKTPAGSKRPIDYSASSPVVAVRI